MEIVKERVRDDLQLKGWIVREGTLYGADFVLYRPQEEFHEHSEYVVYVYTPQLTYEELLGSLRVSSIVKKVSASQKLVIAQETHGGFKYVQVTNN